MASVALLHGQGRGTCAYVSYETCSATCGDMRWDRVCALALRPRDTRFAPGDWRISARGRAVRRGEREGLEAEKEEERRRMYSGGPKERGKKIMKEEQELFKRRDARNLEAHIHLGC